MIFIYSFFYFGAFFRWGGGLGRTLWAHLNIVPSMYVRIMDCTKHMALLFSSQIHFLTSVTFSCPLVHVDVTKPQKASISSRSHCILVFLSFKGKRWWNVLNMTGDIKNVNMTKIAFNTIAKAYWFSTSPKWPHCRYYAIVCTISGVVLTVHCTYLSTGFLEKAEGLHVTVLQFITVKLHTWTHQFKGS